MDARESRPLHFNSFYMVSPGQTWAGLWSHPRSDGVEYNSLDFWSRLAKQAESGLLDTIFLADGLGVMDVYEGAPDALVRAGALCPTMDPMVVVSAMAAVTNDLSFGITGNTSYERPYLLARRLSTLDHLSGGRLAWNIVTGAIGAAAKAMGEQSVAHDKRYDLADEYMDVMYKLWESSWEDGAAVRDRNTGSFADPKKVHSIHHESANFRCDGIHLAEPSPQRTPLLFAAGASPRGIAFAGRHAECTFMQTNDLGFARKVVSKYRSAAVHEGRNPDSVKVFNAATIIVGATEQEAHEKLREYRGYIDTSGNLAIISGFLGIDLSQYSPDDSVEAVDSEGFQSLAESMRASNGGRRLSIRDVAEFSGVGPREAFFVGSGRQVCEELIRWRDEADVDGFNLVRTVEPEGLQDFIDHVVPELQERGAYKTTYKEGPLRSKLFPQHSEHLGPSHYGAQFKLG